MGRTLYFTELQSVHQNLLDMGDTVTALFDEAVSTFAAPFGGSLAKARELEIQTDNQHRMIHDKCLKLITLQAPVARDARLITGILDAIVDLELIGDYCLEMAMLSRSVQRRPPSQIMTRLSEISAAVRTVLQSAIDCWRGIAPQPGWFSAPAAKAECNALYEKLSQLTAAPGNPSVHVDLLMICRHLERIVRHAVCLADQAATAAPVERATQA